MLPFALEASPGRSRHEQASQAALNQVQPVGDLCPGKPFCPQHAQFSEAAFHSHSCFMDWNSWKFFFHAGKVGPWSPSSIVYH